MRTMPVKRPIQANLDFDIGFMTLYCQQSTNRIYTNTVEIIRSQAQYPLQTALKRSLERLI